ncbi:uncharacterized protein [Typha latifolia]|uniref:uncharacterized protein n=1 Tax=Typha latifolia TaxID=4733 RepID=UPI003C2E806F
MAELDDGENFSSLSFRFLPVGEQNWSIGWDSPTFGFSFSDGLPGTEMCSADEVFLGGKLLPFRPRHQPPSPLKRRETHKAKSHLLDHQRSESLDEIIRKSARGGLAAWSLRAASDSVSRIVPPPAAEARPRPKWYVVAFGSVRIPAEVELKDIRNRQKRRKPSHGHGARQGVKGPWNLLRSLSCKGVECSVAAAPTPLGLVSHLRG